MEDSTQKQIMLLRYQASPIRFIENMWGLTPQPLHEEFKNALTFVPLDQVKAEWFKPFIRGKHITWQQWLILTAIERALAGRGSRKISVRSGNGIGKDGCAAWLILWFLVCFPEAQGSATAPTSDQIYDVLWKEVALWRGRMPQKIQDAIEWQSDYVRIKERPETWFFRARTAKKEQPEALYGMHGEYVFLIGDEASGIADEVFAAAETSLTNENILVLLIGNPIRNEGYFYDSHERNKAKWQCLTFDSRQSPLVSTQFVQGYLDEANGDEEDDEFRSHIRGIPPKIGVIDEKGYVGLFVDSDIRRVPFDSFVGWKRLGVDPAGDGDNMAKWVIRDAFKAKVVHRERVSTGKSIAERTATLMEYHKITAKEVTIDGFGVGMYAVQELGLLGHKVRAVNTGDKAEDDAKFENMRAEIYWRGKEWVSKGGYFDNQDDWDEAKTVKFKRNLRGKIQIMSKDEMRRQGIKSPDAMDAWSLTFVEPEKASNKREREKERVKENVRPMTEQEKVATSLY